MKKAIEILQKEIERQTIFLKAETDAYYVVKIQGVINELDSAVKKLNIPVIIQALPKRLSNEAYKQAKYSRYEVFMKWWDKQV